MTVINPEVLIFPSNKVLSVVDFFPHEHILTFIGMIYDRKARFLF